MITKPIILREMDVKGLVEKLRNLDRFPGNISEYSSLKREQGLLLDCDIIVPMDTGSPQKFVLEGNRLDSINYTDLVFGSDSSKSVMEYFRDNGFGRLFRKILENGCIGLVHYQPIKEIYYMGLPVKIKDKPAHPFR